MHAVHTQCEVLDVSKYSDPTLGPFQQVFGSRLGFFLASYVCIWDLARLNCHPFWPIFNHFYPFFIPHIEVSPLWGPREGRGDVALLNPPLWGGRTVRCACAVRKVGHSPPPVGSFLGVGLLQGTIAIVCPCSINPPPSCVYVPLQTCTLRPVYGDTFSGCLLRGPLLSFLRPLLHSPWTLMLEIRCSTLAPTGCEFRPQWWGLRPTDYYTWSISKTR